MAGLAAPTHRLHCTPPSYTISCMKFSYELFENGIMFILIFTVMLKESDGVSAACTVPPVRP